MSTPPNPPSLEPPNTEADEVARWHERITLANRIYDKWEKRFQCKNGWDWYEGYQGANAHLLGDPESDRYIINLVYPTVEVKIPSLYFRNPGVSVIPKPSREDDAMTNIQERAKLREDTANTVMMDPDMRLKQQTNHGLKHSFFYFGMIETGYSGSSTFNPNSGRPMLEGDRPLRGQDGEDLVEPPMVITDEQVYYKHIRPQQFRVSARAGIDLQHDCDWSGYYEWVYAADLKRDPLIQNRDKINATGKYQEDYTGKIDLTDNKMPDGYLNNEELPSKQGMLKVWHIVDHRTETRFLLPDEGDYYLLKPLPYMVFPFSGLKHHERSDGWYPMPPHFNWLSPQAELNNTREMQKLHRKRMIRRYQMQKGSISEDEKSKMETGGDGVIVETNTPVPSVIPIEDAPLDFAVTRNVPQSKEDFLEISATGSDQRQAQAQAETATQATVIETRARIRESFGQENIATWISDIAKKTIQIIEKQFTLPMVIIRNVDVLSPSAPIEMMRVMGTWQEITAEQLGPLNYDVTVSAESLSPINEDVQNQKLLEMLQTISGNPVLMVMLRTSDDLLRRTLAVAGIRNEKAIQQVKTALEIGLLMVTAGASAQLPQDPGKSGENAAATTQGGPPSPATGAALPGLPAQVGQIRNQIGLR